MHLIHVIEVMEFYYSKLCTHVSEIIWQSYTTQNIDIVTVD